MAHAMQQTQSFSRHAAAQFKGLPPLLSRVRLTSCSVHSAHTSQPLLHEQGLQDFQQEPLAQQHRGQQQQQQLHQKQQLQSKAQEQQLQHDRDINTQEEQHQLPLIDDWLQRSRLLVGPDGVDRLATLNILLVGLGGVGSFAAEFLCRAGVGAMTIVDGDTVDTTNRNRQLPALRSTVGQLKTQVVAQRLTDINPELKLTVHQEFLDPVRAAALVQEQQYHYVIDCIDSVAPKHALLLAGHEAGVPTISSMGAGGRLDPSRVRLADISQTYNDAFAAVVRKQLRKAGVSSGITVVFSEEPAKPASLALTQQQYKRSYFGTSSYIPALFGLYIASHVIRQVVEAGYQLPKPAAGSAASSKSSSSGKLSAKGKAGKSKGKASGSSMSSQSGNSTTGSHSSGGGASIGDGSSTASTDSSTGDVMGSSASRNVSTAASADPPSSKNGHSSIGAQSGLSSSSRSISRSRPSASAQGSQHCRQPQQPAAGSAGQMQLFSSYEQCQGVGMGLDGEGL